MTSSDDLGPSPVRHAKAWTLLGTLVPGLGMLRAGRRVLGGVLVGIFALGVIALGVTVFVHRRSLADLATPGLLNTAAVVLVTLTVLWVLVIGATYLMLRPHTGSRGQQVAGGVFVAVLSFLVAAPLAVAAQYAHNSAQFIGSTFQSETKSKSATRPTATKGTDPWANKRRVNILLLGGDSGTNRDIKLGVRTDTVIMASIDTATGDTVLVSLPRGTARMPFPKNSPLAKKFPHGFTNGNPDDGNWMLNAMYLEVPKLVDKNILGDTDNLGADALKLSVGAALGQKVDYFVLVNLDGFKKLINALGGVRLNINERIPIGGNTDKKIPPSDYLEPGPNQHLDGFKAMWYARGRYGLANGDFDRMDRQRCVIKAVIDQADPATMLTRYEAIARASKDMIATDIPQEELGAMVKLSLRVKHGNVRSIVFRHGEDGFLVYNPNFSLMRKRVARAISEATVDDPASSSPSPSAKRSPSAPKSTSGSKTTSEDVSDICAYHPGK